jgi:AcrR family transcriptional regulator
MAPASTHPTPRRQPQQRRAQQTVEAVLDAVVRLLKRGSSRAITTNHIAATAGISIGSLYQYFPDKGAIFVALHERHLLQIDQLIQSTLVEHAAEPLDELIRALVDAMVEAHATDPEFFKRLQMEVPHRAGETRDFAVRLHGVFRLAMAARAHELKRGRDLDTAAFVVTHMVESLCHGAVLRRPAGLSLASAKKEITKAVLAYLRA